MNEINRCALLDADFISKLYFTKVNESDRMIYCILGIDSFHFITHQQISIELGRHNYLASQWLNETENVNVYTDKDLVLLLRENFGEAAYGYYVEMLRRSCDIFSQKFFDTYYAALESYVIDLWGKYDLDSFIALIEACDDVIGTDNNLGEIKLYTTAQVLTQSGSDKLYIFCSDDRKARYALSIQEDMECISPLASFYLAKKYLKMPKEEAQRFFDSWMDFHYEHNGQTHFRVYSISGNQLEKLPGQDIFDMLYNDELYLKKDGFFQRK